MIDIRDKIEEWRQNLLDLTKRNTLINCRISSRGAVRIVHPSAEDVWQRIGIGDGGMTFSRKEDLVPSEVDPSENVSPATTGLGDQIGIFPDTIPKKKHRNPPLDECLQSGFLKDDHLIAELTDRELDLRLRRLHLYAKESLSEKGVHSLFLGFGLLKWYESNDSEIALYSPLMLVPVDLDRRTVDAPWTISEYEDDAVQNYSLGQLLKDQFDVELPVLPQLSELEASGARREFLSEVREAIADFKRWEVVDDVVLNNFSFQKIAMWQDLGDNWERIGKHDLCRSIAGDEPAVAADIDLPAPEEFDDRIPPQSLHTILDCDSSQLEAIVAVKVGMNLVLDGPPGTGKSQTIANLIAEFLAAGKSVLFVSEKSAALEVVKRRLDDRNLGDFCLECHSHKANKKAIVKELARCLHLDREEYPDQRRELEDLQAVRNRLNHYARALHRRREPLGITAYQAHGRLARVDQGPRSRCLTDEPVNVTSHYLRVIYESIARLADCSSVIEKYEEFPWRGCELRGASLSAEDDVRHHFSFLAKTFREIGHEFEGLVGLGVLMSIPSPRDLNNVLKQLRDLSRIPTVPSAWLEQLPRIVAENVMELATSAADEAELRQQLSQYVADIENCFPTACVEELSHSDDEWNRLVRPHSAETVRTQIEHFADLLSDVRQLKRCVAETEDAMKDVMGCLSVPLSTEPTVQLLGRLVEIGNVIANTGALCRSWFDESRRTEIRSIASKCLADVNEVEPIRQDLVQRLSFRVFESEAKEFADKSIRFESVWKRLFGGFGAYKRELEDLYIDEMPSTTKGLLEDLRQLRRFHRRMEVVHRRKEELAADLVSGSEGKTDWQQNLDGLDAVGRLCGLMIKVPRQLVDGLCSPDKINRDALADAVRHLEESLQRLEEQQEQVDSRLAVRQVGPERVPYDNVPATVFDDWLDQIVRFLEKRLQVLDQVQSVLISSEDVQVDLLRDHEKSSQSLAAACGARQQATAHLGDLGIEISADEALQEWDAANWLLDALDEHGEELPAGVMLAATSDAIKEQIEAGRLRVKQAAGDSFRESWSYLRKVFDVKSSVSMGLTIAEEPVLSLANWLEERSTDLAGLRLWMRFRQIQSDLKEQGVPNLVEELLRGEFHPDEAKNVFDACFYRKWLDMVYQSDDHLREFEAHDHERLIQKFRDLDRQIIRNGYCRVRSRLLNDPDRPHAELRGAPSSSELGTLQRECNKKSRHLPLRTLFQRIPNMMIRLKPCVMMSPLAVSTYLNTEQIRFDLVIFDEASQVRPFDAIGAIYRGKQLVVAGDQKQMPPTTFFDRMGTEDDLDENEEESGLDNLRDYESILDVCLSIGLPRKRLRWHYRSKREQLIAFSNHHFYDNDLVTFPSVQDGDGARAVEHVFVEDGRWKSGSGGGFNDIEARRTVELIFEHFENHSNSSLGVVTFNQRQQVAVLDYLYEALKVRPEMEEFCSEAVEEALFVKNLENVQGDERDVILLSMVYGFDQNGKFHKRFGPLNLQGGERRLNVAITRARERIIFVSSVRSRDLDLSSTVKVGPHLLKSYIEYAERGIAALGAERVEDSGADFDSPFEAEVFDELERHGFDVRKQIGCGGYRIDLAIVHPDHPGQFVLGIECDGATYHSSKTARDRDRLRQSVLEDNLGWTIFRIWSTDWIRDRKRQIRRVIDAYERAMLADSTDDVPAEEALPEHPEGMQPKIIERQVHSENDGERNFDNIDAVPNEERVEDSEADFDSPFEAEVFDELERHGLDVRKQVECGSYRIDLAIVHPDHPGQYVLGIECDGATYHSSKTSRDRDRLRQSVLEDNLGWTIFRIWSTDWIRDRKRQTQRVIAAYERALIADSIDDVPAGDTLSEHSEQMQPKIIERPAHSENTRVRNFFVNIDAVPNEDIVSILLVELKKYGATERGDLIRQVARELGFMRSGHRIRARVGGVIDQCVAQVLLKVQEDGRLVVTR